MGATYAGEIPMRDLVLMMAPPATIFYFLAFPDQFRELLAWAAALF
jgi:hypothetical protein